MNDQAHKSGDSSKRRRGLLGIAAVGVSVLAILVFRPQSPPVSPAGDPGAVADERSSGDRVVLVADFREAESSCGCGQIIQRVRVLATKGVPIEEIDPRRSPDRAASYRALVNPTVIVTDRAGVELRRFEGEDENTVSMLDAELSRLAAP